MHIALFVLAFLWFAFIAPPHVTMAVAACIVLVTTVVHLTAKAIVGGTSFYEAFKSVGLSVALLMLGLVAYLSYAKGIHISTADTLGTLAILAYFFMCYTLGFKFGLQATLGASALVAAISTVISAALLYGLRNILA